MATDSRFDPADDPRDLEAVRRNWGWLLALGAVQILAGVIALLMTVTATYATVVVLGVLALVAGIAELISLFWSRNWEEAVSHLLVGLLYGAFGVLVLLNPTMAAVTLTLVLAVLLVAGGLLRVAMAATGRFPGWGWAALGGLISVLLGVLVLSGWPESGLWVIGLFVGIDLIFMGWNWVVLALAIRSATAPPRPETPPAVSAP